MIKEGGFTARLVSVNIGIVLIAALSIFSFDISRFMEHLKIIGGILFYLYRAKKRGEVCIGCPYGRQCTGHCGGHGQETKHKKKH